LPLSGLELRPRSATEIVDAAFQLYRRHFAALVMLSAVVFTPYVLLELLLTGGQSNEPVVQPVAMVALFAFGWIFGSLSEAAIVLAVSNSYLRGEPDPGDSLRRTARRLGAIMLAVLVKWLFIGTGMAAGFVAGALAGGIVAVITNLLIANALTAVAAAVIFVVGALLGVGLGFRYFAFYFAIPATVILEGAGVRAGLRRSRMLSSGAKRKILGALGLPILLFFGIQFVLLATFELLPGPRYLASLGWQVVNVVASPILSVIATLLYYDARIRKEGFDIQVMAAELGTSAASPPATTVPSA
jgi:hypothetical protein